MARLVKKKKKEVGVSPYELLFRGEQKTDNILIRIIDFDADHLEEKPVDEIKKTFDYQNKETVSWLNIDGLHNIQVMEEIANGFNLDKAILSDVMNTDSRPKVQEHDNCIYISIKMLQHDEQSKTINVENLSLVIAKTMVISFQERKGDVFEPIRERIRGQKRRLRTSGTDYLAFALLDIVVDNYIYILSILGEKIEALEDILLTNPQQNIIDEINGLKRELNFLRKNINPAKEMITALSKMESEFIDEANDMHYKELVNNISQAIETSDSYREILSDQLNIYHTTISSKLNDIMKFLTIFSVIFIPLTFIAGIYGTNFDVVPELHYEYSYFIMWGIMILVAISMLIYFKKKKWY